MVELQHTQTKAKAHASTWAQLTKLTEALLRTELTTFTEALIRAEDHTEDLLDKINKPQSP